MSGRIPLSSSSKSRHPGTQTAIESVGLLIAVCVRQQLRPMNGRLLNARLFVGHAEVPRSVLHLIGG